MLDMMIANLFRRNRKIAGVDEEVGFSRDGRLKPEMLCHNNSPLMKPIPPGPDFRR
jgi:hypothetical protein